MTYASALIDVVERDLLDEDNDRWEAAEHLENLSSGERQLVYLLPTAYAVTGVYQLVAGTKQALPDGTSSYQDPSANTLAQAIDLIEVTRNMGTDGATEGNAITPIEKDVMDQMLPGWHGATASATVDHFIPDPKDPTSFFVYPPQPSSSMGWIEAVYPGVPPTITADPGPSYDVDINMKDIYIEPLKHYMKFAAYAKNAATSEFDSARAIYEWNQFVTLIGRKDLVERDFNLVKRHRYGNQS